ncbi:Hypothetical protein R9X50_00737300 [Acrodontium crateriforme]|uniref:Uncharacterized protein n=1 Tax=Acrodontium crateriforme TaxID=150365 RepID=A0AAQ3M9N6_9PEZI|nr:Hypothetical protein R9X50_00737300 [Acrodontium crateriforme]
MVTLSLSLQEEREAIRQARSGTNVDQQVYARRAADIRAYLDRESSALATSSRVPGDGCSSASSKNDSPVSSRNGRLDDMRAWNVDNYPTKHQADAATSNMTAPNRLWSDSSLYNAEYQIPWSFPADSSHNTSTHNTFSQSSLTSSFYHGNLPTRQMGNSQNNASLVNVNRDDLMRTQSHYRSDHSSNFGENYGYINDHSASVPHYQNHQPNNLVNSQTAPPFTDASAGFPPTYQYQVHSVATTADLVGSSNSPYHTPSIISTSSCSTNCSSTGIQCDQCLRRASHSTQSFLPESEWTQNYSSYNG